MLDTGSSSRFMKSSSPMPQLPSRHLWNAAILIASALLALVADRVAAAPVRRSAANALADVPDVGSLIARIGADSVSSPLRIGLAVDPFEARLETIEQSGVAPEGSTPTVPASPARNGGLTAILVADQGRVAVIDDRLVSVGDMLADSGRVSSIQADRVWVVEKNGRWRMLTLANRGAR